jgi:aspartate carbamoyltransferase catalytic subunit
VSALQPSHLLSTRDLRDSDLQTLFKAAKKFKAGASPALLTGKTIVQFFVENSTRTRTSFETAVRKLGGTNLGFSASTSSLKKGESLIDTAQNIQALGADAIVIRHSESGAAQLLARSIDLSVINAGDGTHEHPSQALLDAFTLLEVWGSLKGKRVLILGDILHSRVARSNFHLLKSLGAKVTVCAPGTLLPVGLDSLGVSVAERLEDALTETDAVMALRVQLERHATPLLPSVGEYARFWGLGKQRLGLLKKGALLLHPGPVNWGVELMPEAQAFDGNLILKQVENGVFVRMAILGWLLNPEGMRKHG